MAFMGHQKLFPSDLGGCLSLEIFKDFQLQSSGQKCFMIYSEHGIKTPYPCLFLILVYHFIFDAVCVTIY